MSVLSSNFLGYLLYFILKIPYMLIHGRQADNLGIVIYVSSSEAQLT